MPTFQIWYSLEVEQLNAKHILAVELVKLIAGFCTEFSLINLHKESKSKGDFTAFIYFPQLFLGSE